MNNNDIKIKVAVNLTHFSFPIDPITNTTLSNAFYVNNMYDNLISVNEDGVYKPELASTFFWHGNELIFEFEKSNINSEDAEFSLRRAILNEFNDHANLSYLVCNDTKSEDECIKKIFSKNEKLHIVVEKAENRPLVVPLLVALNYKIVHKKCFSSAVYKDAKIVDYSITTGKYYLPTDDIKVLKLNKRHEDIYPRAARDVKVIDANNANIVEKIKSKEVDVVSTTVPLTIDSAQSAKDNNWQVFETFPISIAMAVFSEKGMSNLATEERFYIGNIINNEVNKRKFLSSQSTLEFLQHFGEGYLNLEQSGQIKKMRSESKKNSKDATLGLPNSLNWSEFEKSNPNVKVVKLEKPALFLPLSEQPDVFILTNDVSFDASFTMFSFAVKSGFFVYEGKSKEQIIEEFISQKTAQDRIEYLNKVHFYSLKNCKIYPFWASPYTTAARPGIEVNMSKYNSRTLLWNLKID